MTSSWIPCHPNLHLTMKGVQQPLEYVPKSPVYPPPDDSSEDSSVPDLETPREQMVPEPGKLKKSDHVN